MKQSAPMSVLSGLAAAIVCSFAVTPTAADPPDPSIYLSGPCEMKEDLCITDDGSDEYMLVQPQVDVDADGNIFVLDRKLHNIRKFDGNGEILCTFGGLGEGPGEFGEFSVGMAVTDEGDVIVTDFMNARITKFSNDGAYLLDAKLPPMTVIYHMESGGEGLLVAEMQTLSSEDVTSIEHRIARFDRRLNLVDIVDSLVCRVMVNVENNYEWLPYRSGLKWAVTTDGGVAIARHDEYEIRVLSAALDVVGTIEGQTDRVAVGDADKRRFVAESKNDGQRRSREKMDLGEWKPYIVDLLVDHNGYFLVCLFDEQDSNTLFDVYAPDGSYVTRATLPPVEKLRVSRAGFVYFVEEFEDVPPRICRGYLVAPGAN